MCGCRVTSKSGCPVWGSGPPHVHVSRPFRGFVGGEDGNVAPAEDPRSTRGSFPAVTLSGLGNPRPRRPRLLSIPAEPRAGQRPDGRGAGNTAILQTRERPRGSATTPDLPRTGGTVSAPCCSLSPSSCGAVWGQARFFTSAATPAPQELFVARTYSSLPSRPGGDAHSERRSLRHAPISPLFLPLPRSPETVHEFRRRSSGPPAPSALDLERRFTPRTTALPPVGCSHLACGFPCAPPPGHPPSPPFSFRAWVPHVSAGRVSEVCPLLVFRATALSFAPAIPTGPFLLRRLHLSEEGAPGCPRTRLPRCCPHPLGG